MLEGANWSHTSTGRKGGTTGEKETRRKRWRRSSGQGESERGHERKSMRGVLQQEDSNTKILK
jgi:hypothetical protein